MAITTDQARENTFDSFLGGNNRQQESPGVSALRRMHDQSESSKQGNPGMPGNPSMPGIGGQISGPGGNRQPGYTQPGGPPDQLQDVYMHSNWPHAQPPQTQNQMQAAQPQPPQMPGYPSPIGSALQMPQQPQRPPQYGMPGGPGGGQQPGVEALRQLFAQNGMRGNMPGFG